MPSSYSPEKRSFLSKGRAESDINLLKGGATYDKGETLKLTLQQVTELKEGGEQMLKQYEKLKSIEFINGYDSVIDQIERLEDFIGSAANHWQRDRKLREDYVYACLSDDQSAYKAPTKEKLFSEITQLDDEAKQGLKKGIGVGYMRQQTEIILSQMQNFATKYGLQLPPIDLSFKEFEPGLAHRELKRILEMTLNAKLYELEKELGVNNPK